MGHQEHHHQHHGAGETDESGLAELVDLDAEVLHAYLSELTGWIEDPAGRPAVRQLADPRPGQRNRNRHVRSARTLPGGRRDRA
jgi:hypothetical protein